MLIFFLLQVSVCGRIEDVNEETSRTVIKFNDCTGTIKCFIPSKSGEPPFFLSKTSLSPGLLVKLVLSLTPFQDRRIFICQRLDEIKNYNEISHHLLATMQSHLKRTSEKYRASLVEGRSNKENNFKNGTQPKTKDNNGKGVESKVNQVSWEEKVKLVIMKAGGRGEEEKLFEVVKIINECAPESSTFEALAKVWTGKMDGKKLRFLLGKLTQDGYIYTSGDKYRAVE